MATSERPAAVIIGHGFLGGYLLEQIEERPVLTLNRSVASVTRHGPPRPGVTMLTADVFEASIRAVLAPHLAKSGCDVFFLLPPSAFAEREAGAALRPLIGVLTDNVVGRVVVASSSGVYATTPAARVAADTAVVAGSPRVQRLLDIEQAWLNSPLDVRVVRLAGLYGRGRLIGRHALTAGQPLSGAGSDWLNLVHGEDAARALLLASAPELEQRLLLISDGCPRRRREYYASLAALLGTAAPVFDASVGRRGGASRRCDPGASWRALNSAPRQVDLTRALKALL